MYLHLCYVTGMLKYVEMNVFIPWNPDTQSITVSTNSAAASFELVHVYFHDRNGNNAGSVHIRFFTQIQYQIGACTGSYDYKRFPDTLPTTRQKTWTLKYNTAEQRVVLYCNEVQVANVLLTNLCTLSYWRAYWGRKPTQIEFSCSAAASYRYCFSSNAGKYNGAFWEVLHCW